MIEQVQVMPLLVAACPSFTPMWVEHHQENGDDLLYVVAGEFANHLLSLFKNNDTACFSAIASVIEKIHSDGSPEASQLATIGILEAVENVWSNNGADPNLFSKFLGPNSQWWWQSINDFWFGKVPVVGWRG